MKVISGGFINFYLQESILYPVDYTYNTPFSFFHKNTSSFQTQDNAYVAL